ncbi:hypothetical protein, partial [Sphingobium fuliginis]|uniref:hypothetical protein n=1 Tax=Sphingobium fuliginis (strain ATCC 27551) TaxID=336203 RepID=UPI001E643DF3
QTRQHHAMAQMIKSSLRPRANRHSDDDEPKMMVFRDPERSLLEVGEHRKHGKVSFAGRQG